MEERKGNARIHNMTSVAQSSTSDAVQVQPPLLHLGPGPGWRSSSLDLRVVGAQRRPWRWCWCSEETLEVEVEVLVLRGDPGGGGGAAAQRRPWRWCWCSETLEVGLVLRGDLQG